MSDLASKRCEPCSSDAKLASPDETSCHMQKLANWKIIDPDGIKRLRRTFTVKDFKQALALANKIGDIAEAENHHPEILVEWGKVTVTWWSHKIKGLHVNDFIMAAKTDELAH